MDEGPEPQELMERMEHALHESGEHQKKNIRSAVVASVLAVCAALGSLLAGHSANDAIMLRSEASDQWSYYQAKSTKGHLYEIEADLLRSLGKTDVASVGTAEKIKQYDAQKTQVEKRATDLERESEHALKSHQIYSFAVACFQIGIVLVSISILMDSIVLFGASISAGVLGVVLVIVGLVR